jgi:hypothetical protein
VGTATLPVADLSGQQNPDDTSATRACDPDDENDALADAEDNGPLVANPGQEDVDGDLRGAARDHRRGVG